MTRRHHLTTAIVAVTFLAVGLGLSAGLSLTDSAHADRLWAEKTPVNPAALNEDDPVNLGSFSRLAKTLSPAVVNIIVERKSGHGSQFQEYLKRHYGQIPKEYMMKGAGSGFIVNADGWILTNNHVVESAAKIEVRLQNGDTYEAKVVGTDPKTDVALLKIQPKGRLAVAPLGDSDALETGEWVIAIGNPFGLNHTVTAGIVSAKHRNDVNPDGRQLYANFIQTDASINPGNSGGPLINIRGEVIGINTAINSAGQGIGFAIPVNMVKTLLPQLRRGEVRRSWLGVMIQAVDPRLATSLGLERPRGALVAEVVRGGPSDRAGIQPGDVILGFAGKPVNDSKDLPWLASTAGIGKKVPVKVWRNKRRHTLHVTMGTLPNQPGEAGVDPDVDKPGAPDTNLAPGGLGMRVESLTPRLAKRLGMKRTSGGVVVTQVDRGGPADMAGLESGDVILRVSNENIQNAGDFKRLITKIEAGRVVMLLVQRGDRKLFRAFTRQ